MQTVTARQHELIEQILRRINRKIGYDLLPRKDGDLEVRLSFTRLTTQTQISAEALEASATDVAQFQALRGKIKRVFDRMCAPEPPPKLPNVEMQKEGSFFRPSGFSPSRRGRR